MSRNQIQLVIDRQVGFAEDTSFGGVGPYERLVGKVYFAIDPDEEGLPFIADLELAPRNADGLVEFAADLNILKPVDLTKGNGRMLYEFSNRGGRGAMRFNDGGAGDMTSAAWAGNGFLMRQGYTVVWSGWQGDLISNGSNIVAYLPEARENGRPMRGRIRQEFIVDTDGVLSMPVSGAASIECYPVLDRANATLTQRELERNPRIAVPDAEWELARAERKNGSVELTGSNTDLYIRGGFKPGWIYELIYETQGSRVMNLGFLGVRELISFLHHAADDSFGTRNPLADSFDKAYAYGSSLSGRVIREFIYEGWNEDAQERRVFDAVQTHTGSGRLFMNHRFAQVGRYPRQHEEHSWAAERYPFTFVAIPDPFTEKVDAMLKRPSSDPLIMHTHTSTEYWQRHGSLNHTDCRDGGDVELPDSTRMYWLAGAPHGPATMNPGWIGEAAPNSISPGPMLRACLVSMDRWATDGLVPAGNLLPSQTASTLGSPSEVLKRFPEIPGLRLPADASQMPYYNYGAAFDRGLLTVLPPEAVPGQSYPIQVPDIDADGNDLSGLRYPDIEVPLGTYTGWAVRKQGFGGPDTLSNSGSFIPFARTKAQREVSGDPRPSVEERYVSHEAYVSAVTKVVEGLLKKRLLLDEDADRFLEAARKKNPLDSSVPLGPLLNGSSD